MSDNLATYTFFDNGRPVGENKVPRGVWRSLHHLPDWCFFCPTCGEIWGRVIRTDPGGGFRHWIFTTRPCAKHGDGQMLIGQDLTHCSAPLLQRELLAILERYPNV